MSSSYHFAPQTLRDLTDEFSKHRLTEAVIKPLRKNHNDKNQVYSGSDFRPLFPIFDMNFSLRGASESRKKGGVGRGRPIPEAVFNSFAWAKPNGTLVPARNVRMIVYAQYPETRLSGFQTLRNDMPEGMSVEFTKQNPSSHRYLVIGRRGAGEAVAFLIVDPGRIFEDEVEDLPSAPGSRVWRHLTVKTAFNTQLFAMLGECSMLDLPGCRLKSDGTTVPFNGTQVCGYTLEHALNIQPNSSKYGDFEGIELKTHTQSKVTLFTPEPDMGLYRDNFARFMERYGYLDQHGNYRLTGVHKVDVQSPKSGLTLEVKNHRRGESLASRADANVHVGLFDDYGDLAAGWSLERLLNCWSAKHNEAVYIPAIKNPTIDRELRSLGHRYTVRFSDRVMWCRDTSAEQLFEALYNGTLFLDPAPKYCPSDPSLNKRRSQWRVNDIAVAAEDLYRDVEFIDLRNSLEMEGQFEYLDN